MYRGEDARVGGEGGCETVCGPGVEADGVRGEGEGDGFPEMGFVALKIDLRGGEDEAAAGEEAFLECPGSL